MKNIIYLLAMIGCCLLWSCVDEDEFDSKIDIPSPPNLSDDTPINSKIKAMYEKYGCYIMYQFEDEEIRYDWSTLITTPTYKQPKEDYILSVLDFLDSDVLGVLPADIRKFISLNVYLTDSLRGNYNEWDGHLLNSKLILGRVGKSFDDLDKRTLQRAWISLFIERMLTIWPYPAEFAAVSHDGYNPTSISSSGSVISYAYLASSTDIVGLYAILNFGRKGFYNRTGSRLCTTTYAQDFGDYVAFILLADDEEKAAMFAKNENIEKKVKLVKEYFQKNLGIVLSK